jgi:hypothetical protein
LLARHLLHLLSIEGEVSLLLPPLLLCLPLLLNLVFLVIKLFVLGFLIALRSITLGSSKFLLLAVVFELGRCHDLVASGGGGFREAFGELNSQSGIVQIMITRGR